MKFPALRPPFVSRPTSHGGVRRIPGHPPAPRWQRAATLVVLDGGPIGAHVGGRVTGLSTMPLPTARPPERRVRLWLAYDGRHHTGWQYSGDGRSVQEQVESAVRKILKSDHLVRVHASGRTDAGVHALGQVVHFAVPDDWRMDGDAWCRAINCFLPPSIRVLDADEAQPDSMPATARPENITGTSFSTARPAPAGSRRGMALAMAAGFGGHAGRRRLFLGNTIFPHLRRSAMMARTRPGNGRNVRRLWRADLTPTARI